MCSAGEVLADFLRTETRKESNWAGRQAFSGWLDTARGTRKIDEIPAQRGESTDTKKPNREGLGFESGGVVPRYRKPPCLIGEDTVGEIIYDAEVRVDFGCLRAFPTVDSLHCHDQRPGFLTFRWRHE